MGYRLVDAMAESRSRENKNSCNNQDCLAKPWYSYRSIHGGRFVLQWMAVCKASNPFNIWESARSAAVEMFNTFNADDYLDRIGLTRPITVNIEGLRQLQYAHLMRVPFENLDIYLGRPIRLDPASFFQKIVQRRRGGFCYELNGLFACLLRSLGFQVDLLSARAANQAGGIRPGV